MAFGRLERSGKQRPMSDINMTPLIDVMLVLLVVFMLTAPLMTSNLKLDLPKSDLPLSEPDRAALSIALTGDGKLYWGETVVEPADFDRRLTQAAQRNADREVQLRADQSVPYGRVADVLGRLQKAGLNRIAFVTETDTGSGSAARAGAAAPTPPAASAP